MPPAWRHVWLNPNPRAALQATGVDERGRKQYLYHPAWRARRESAKFARLVEFGRALPRLRRRVARDLRRPGLPRKRVLALLVRLIDATGLRVGNREYVRENRSYGVTTLRNHHAQLVGARLRLRFRGKSGKPQSVELEDARIAHLVARCRDLPSPQLFVWRDEEGRVRAITSREVNAYIQDAAGAPFTAKDFRTWHATVRAANGLRRTAPAASEARRKRQVVAALRDCADSLGNTLAVCRRSYVHPEVPQAFLEGRLEGTNGPHAPAGLPQREAWVWELLADRAS